MAGEVIIGAAARRGGMRLPHLSGRRGTGLNPDSALIADNRELGLRLWQFKDTHITVL